MSLMLSAQTLRQMLHISCPELYDRATTSNEPVWVSLYLNGVRGMPCMGPISAQCALYEVPGMAAIRIGRAGGISFHRMPVNAVEIELGVALAEKHYPIAFLPVDTTAPVRHGDSIHVRDNMGFSVTVERGR